LLAQHGSRNEAIVHACRDRGFTMSAIAWQLGLSVSRVSRIISMAEARGKTWPFPPPPALEWGQPCRVRAHAKIRI
jgi:hypothetical protein